MKIKNLMGILLVSTAFGNTMVFAETIVKEETTPPAAEGPLTVEQIPSLTNVGKMPESKPVVSSGEVSGNNLNTDQNTGNQNQ
jgi:hypothetical protein